MNYQIKSYNEYDLHPFLMARKLRAITESAYKLGSPWTLIQFHDTLRATTNIFLYIIEEVTTKKWCGFVLGSYVGDNFDIYMVAVLKDYQGQGLGTQLIEFLQQEAQKVEATITLEVRISNESARHVYGKCGFQEVGQIKNYYRRPSEDAIRMLWESK